MNLNLFIDWQMADQSRDYSDACLDLWAEYGCIALQ